MNLRHTAALALIGWYLMMPPMLGDLDSSCNGYHIPTVSDLFWALIAWRNFGEVQMIRCDELQHQVATDSPISEWKQVGEFETLEACRSQYAEDQTSEDREIDYGRTAAKTEFVDEGEQKPSEKDLQLRSQTIAIAIVSQIASEKCIATDDPRLKGN
jgi:hypothetical protein